MDTSLLFPAEFQVLRATVSEKEVALELTFTPPMGCCPICHTHSSRIHSCYQRRLKDLPICGRPVRISLWVRKFFCEQAGCPRKIFTQQFEAALKPYAQRLNRVDDQARSLGLLIGSKPGARICHLAGMPLSASTLLRIMKITPLPEVETPTVLGVDDFAFHRRTRYGTILVDLEKRCPIDLLPDREGKTLEDWLKVHPGVSIVARDRSQVYANAITTICPAAKQVADRWHLLKNLSENIGKFLDTKATLVRQVAHQVAAEQAEDLKGVAQKAISTVAVACIGDTGPLLAESALVALAPSFRNDEEYSTCPAEIQPVTVLGKNIC